MGYKRQMALHLRSRVLLDGNPLQTARRAELYAAFLADNVYGSLSDKYIEEKAISELIEARGATESLKGIIHMLTDAPLSGGHTQLFLNILRAQLEAGLNPAVLITRYIDPRVEYEIRRMGVSQIYYRKQRDIPFVGIIGDLYLHVHMSDIFAIACAARAQSYGSRVFFINHADHTFSFLPLGETCQVEVSGLGHQLSAQHRGVQKQFALGIAAKGYCSPQERIPKRNHFLTIARADKLCPSGALDFTKLADYITSTLGCTLELVGQTGRESWWAEARQNPSIIFRGTVDRNELRAAATTADGYIDSYPMTGGTVLSEIALCQIPIFAISQPFYGYSVVDRVRFTRIDDLKLALHDFVRHRRLYYDLEDLARDVTEFHCYEAFSDRVRKLHSGVTCDIPPFWENYNTSLSDVQILFSARLKVQIPCYVDLPLTDRLMYSIFSIGRMNEKIYFKIKQFSYNIIGRDSLIFDKVRIFLSKKLFH